MAGGVKFTPNPKATGELLAGADMQKLMASIAAEGVTTIKGRMPKIVKRGGGGAYGSALKDGDGWYARIAVRSSFWHWPEYGTARYPATPYIRPAIQQLISTHKGRWTETPK